MDAIIRILTEISRSTHAKSDIFSFREDWLVPAKTYASDSEAHELYNEATSAGFIDEIEPSRWRWRHRLCAKLPQVGSM